MNGVHEQPSTRQALERWAAARVWADPAFGRALVADPAAALAAVGMLPAGRRVELLRETPELLHLVLPPSGETPAGDGELAARVIGRAAADSVFRRALLTDPVSAIESALGVRLPARVRVEVTEASDEVWPIVLPFVGPSVAPGPELSDLALAAAGGGRTDRPNPVNCVDTLVQVSSRARRATTRGC